MSDMEQMNMSMEAADGAVQDKGEITAAELMKAPETEEAAGQNEKAQEAPAQEDDGLAAYREGIARLMDDGWTAEELTAMAADEQVHRALVQGQSLGRAATDYMRRTIQAKTERKRGVPTVRRAATADYSAQNPIAAMSDEEFDAFAKRAREAALAGVKVRI